MTSLVKTKAQGNELQNLFSKFSIENQMKEKAQILNAFRHQFGIVPSLPEFRLFVLQSHIISLDMLFQGGIQPGKFVEWGLPPGRNGRIIPLLFLRGTIPSTLWIYPSRDFEIYPPAWASYGIDLRRIFFIKSNQPLKHLRHIFMEDTFKIVVIDAPRYLTKGMLAFVTRQARLNGQTVFLLRNFFLSERRGNVFAQFRINCAQQTNGSYYIHLIKGGDYAKIRLSNIEIGYV